MVDHGGTARTFNGAGSAMHATYGAVIVCLTSKIDQGTWLSLLALSIDPHYFMRGGRFYYNIHLFVLAAQSRRFPFNYKLAAA